MPNNKVYMVCGLYDASCGSDSIMDTGPWTAVFATEEEAKRACKMVNDFYSDKCKINCKFDVREIDINNLCTVDILRNDLDTEYKECWSPE